LLLFAVKAAELCCNTFKGQ